MCAAKADQHARQRECNGQGRHEQGGQPVPGAIRVKGHEAEIDDQRGSKRRGQRCLGGVAKEHLGCDPDKHRQQKKNDERLHVKADPRRTQLLSLVYMRDAYNNRTSFPRRRESRVQMLHLCHDRPSRRLG